MLTSAEACARIGISRKTLAELINSGELEAIKTGDAPNSHYRISEDSVDAYLERRRAAYLERRKVVPAEAAAS